MKSIQVLGISKEFICCIAEVLSDAGIADHIDLFYNMDLDFGPEIVTKPFSYTIKPFGELPDVDKPVIFGLSGPYNRKPVFDYFLKTPGMIRERYLNVIHPTTYVAGSAILDYGIHLGPAVSVSSQTRIGFGVTVKRGSMIGHHNVIGDYCDINPGVVLSGGVNIGRGCILGTGAIVINKINIGENSYIGAGSVVLKDIPPNSIAYGNPCKVIKPNEKWSI